MRDLAHDLIAQVCVCVAIVASLTGKRQHKVLWTMLME